MRLFVTRDVSPLFRRFTKIQYGGHEQRREIFIPMAVPNPIAAVNHLFALPELRGWM